MNNKRYSVDLGPNLSEWVQRFEAPAATQMREDLCTLRSLVKMGNGELRGWFTEFEARHLVKAGRTRDWTNDRMNDRAQMIDRVLRTKGMLEPEMDPWLEKLKGLTLLEVYVLNTWVRLYWTFSPEMKPESRDRYLLWLFGCDD